MNDKGVRVHLRGVGNPSEYYDGTAEFEGAWVKIVGADGLIAAYPYDRIRKIEIIEVD